MTTRLCSDCINGKPERQIHFENSIFQCSLAESNFLCKQIDYSHYELLCEDDAQKVYSLDKLKEINSMIIKNYRFVESSIKNESYQLPRTYSEFEELINDLHLHLFENTEILGIGLFRTTAVYVDINLHSFQGVSAVDIQDSLRHLWNNILQKDFLAINAGKIFSKEEAVWLATSFLSQFFRIHPYRDGNGRVGRSVVQLILIKCKFSIMYSAPPRKTAKQHSKRYVKALRYSHRRYSKFNFTTINYRRCLEADNFNKHLYTFLLSCTKEKVEDIGAEIEPTDFLENVSLTHSI